jgi:hypothetical protein
MYVNLLFLFRWQRRQYWFAGFVPCVQEHEPTCAGMSTTFFVSVPCLHIYIYTFCHRKEVAQTCMSFIRETIARYLQKRRSCTPGVGCVTALSCVRSTGAGTHQRTYSFPLSEPGPHTPWESRRGSTSRTGKRTVCTCSRYHAPSLRVARRVY